ncbi:MAG: 2OG-Fe(II) oxygenase [Pseudomonadota bacterium]
MAQAARDVLVKLMLEGGHTQEFLMAEGSAELYDLFTCVVNRGSAGADRFFQIPLDGGRRALSFRASQVVAITTTPPVVIQLDEPALEEAVAEPPPPPEPPAPARIEAPRHLIIDDFMSPGEHQDMLAYAIQREERFEVGTVAGEESAHRQNRVFMKFEAEPHSILIQNRLLVWLPFMLRRLGRDPFPVARMESQLTATNNAGYYRQHEDVGRGGAQETSRALSCIYYFFAEPKPFLGGSLKLFDTLVHPNGQRGPAESSVELEPRANRLIVFESDTFHELMPVRCPGGRFADSRFAITTWIWRSENDDPDQRFGWGHFRCNRTPPGLSSGEDEA